MVVRRGRRGGLRLSLPGGLRLGEAVVRGGQEGCREDEGDEKFSSH
jgi:hypothetical protein